MAIQEIDNVARVGKHAGFDVTRLAHGEHLTTLSHAVTFKALTHAGGLVDRTVAKKR